MGLEARIRASRLGFGPQDKDLGLQTKIGPLTCRLGFRPRGGGTEKEKKKEKKEEEKFPLCVKA